MLKCACTAASAAACACTAPDPHRLPVWQTADKPSLSEILFENYLDNSMFSCSQPSLQITASVTAHGHETLGRLTEPIQVLPSRAQHAFPDPSLLPLYM